MSDTSQGEGWWQASDAKWYPPHLHPDVINLPPPPVPAAPPAPPVPPASAFPAPVAPYPAGYGPPPGTSGMSYAPPGPYSVPTNPIDAVVHRPLASWWKRLVAIIIDGAIIGVTFSIFFAIIGALAGNTTTSCGFNCTNNTTQLSGAAVVGVFVLAILPAFLYYGILNGSKRGQTVGKMAMSIAVRDARTGGPIGFWRGIGRYAITILFTFLLFIPYLLDNLSPLWDKRRQAWHDKVVRSVVVDQ